MIERLQIYFHQQYCLNDAFFMLRGHEFIYQLINQLINK